jgi:hypothetical protein
MSCTETRRSARIDALVKPLSKPEETNHQDLALQQPAPLSLDNPPTHLEQSASLSLDDLPTELIQIIAQFVGSTEERVPAFGCFCKEQKRRIKSRTQSFDLSTAPADSYSHPCWAFSCVSKRYRNIVFHGNTTRRFGLGYSRCCIERVVNIPESIRASVS